MIRTNNELLGYTTELNKLEIQKFIAEQSFVPKQKIIQQGKKVFYVYIIKSGIAKCYLTEENGKDFVQEFFGAGEIFGEIETINNNTSFCYIEAITEMKVYKIPQKHFHKLLENNMKFNQLVLKSLAAKIKYKALRHSFNQSHTIESNILRLENHLPEFSKIISKEDIANYLGITLRSLNRTLNILNEKLT